jgi:inosine-uridine nucleoside N-ribohydrolase
MPDATAREHGGLTVVSDPGVDDVVSLVLLDRLFPDAEKLLVSTFGNDAAAVTSATARRFVAHAGGRWRYRPGAELPMSGTLERPWAADYHGAGGVWGAPPPGDGKVRPSPYRWLSEVVSLGPLTEPYRMLRAGRIATITLMGGGFDQAPDRPEYNISMDVRAARLFFEECRDMVPRVVPEDVTRRVRWQRTHALAIPSTNATNHWLRRMLLAWFENYGTPRGRDFVLHDPLAAYLARNPDRARWTRSGLTVAEGGDNHGRTTLSSVNPPCEIALDIDDPDLVAEVIFRLIFDE